MSDFFPSETLLHNLQSKYQTLSFVGRHDMQHFVKVIHGYLALQVTQVSWHQFQTEVKDVENLDGLYDSHNRFINRCLSRCVLMVLHEWVLMSSLSVLETNLIACENPPDFN